METQDRAQIVQDVLSILAPMLSGGGSGEGGTLSGDISDKIEEEVLALQGHWLTISDAWSDQTDADARKARERFDGLDELAQKLDDRLTALEVEEMMHDVPLPDGAKEEFIERPYSDEGQEWETFPWGILSNGWAEDHGYGVFLVNISLVWGDESFEVDDTPVSIPEDSDVYYVGIEFDGESVGVPEASTDKDVFLPDDEVYRTWLYSFRREPDLGVYLNSVNNVGGIEIDAAWGPA